MRLSKVNLFSYLETRGLLTPGSLPSCESPGEGNINWVQRVRRPDGSSFIVKQARESLERFPEYQAPPRRIALEARYYEVTGPYDTEQVRPGILDFDSEHFVLVLEDMGEAARLDDALAQGRDVTRALQRLARFLGAVHGGTRDGDPAFDVGTLLAHVLLAQLSNASLDAVATTRAVWEHYTTEHGPAGLCAFSDVARYAGIEMLRRTLGAARVAAVEADEASLRAVALGRALSLTPPDRPERLPQPH